MSTRSRANPWFRPIRPIAELLVLAAIKDAAFERRIRPTVDPAPADYQGYGAAITKALLRARLSDKLIHTARVLDPEFNRRCLEVCPDL